MSKTIQTNVVSLNENKLEKLINCYVEIANADDFIHENEVTLIQHAIKSWSMDITIDKPKSGEKLKVKK